LNAVIRAFIAVLISLIDQCGLYAIDGPHFFAVTVETATAGEGVAATVSGGASVTFLDVASVFDVSFEATVIVGCG
jgi:hypothetical protein